MAGEIPRLPIPVPLLLLQLLLLLLLLLEPHCHVQKLWPGAGHHSDVDHVLDLLEEGGIVPLDIIVVGADMFICHRLRASGKSQFVFLHQLLLLLLHPVTFLLARFILRQLI